jgi:hypothetical protein
LDVADEQLAVCVAAGQVREERVEASDRSVDVTGDVVEDEPDVGQAQVRAGSAGSRWRDR